MWTRQHTVLILELEELWAVRQGPPGLVCGCLCPRLAPFIIGPPVNTPGSIRATGMGEAVGRGGGGVGNSCSVIFYTSGSVAQKTDKDRQKEGRGEKKNKKQGLEGWERGRQGAWTNRLIKQGCFVRPGRCGGIWSRVFICGVVLHW